MPKSRGRKHKKKNNKTARANKKHLDREVFMKDGLEIIREGKNVFFRNNRTTEEHEKFISEVKKNRPLQLENIEKSIDRIIEIFQNNNSLKILGGLAYNQIANQFNPQDDGLSEVTLELGLSFATAIPNLSDNEPLPETINELIGLLIAVRHGYNAYIMTETVTGKYSELEGKLRFKTILEALYIRGEGYSEHVYSIFTELFKGHDDFLRKQYGFSSKEILETVLQLEDSFCCRLILPNGLPHPANQSRFVQWSQNKNEVDILNAGKHFIDFFGDENPDLIVENTKIHGFRIDDISNYDKLFKIRFRYNFQKAVVDEISQAFGDNHNFLNLKFKGLPLNDSKITTNPVIKLNTDYYLFAFALPTRNLFSITERLIERADADYYQSKYLGNKYSLSRDNYLEFKATQLFKKIIPASDSYPNCKYVTQDENGKDYETELDLLIKSDKAVYLIEMKAGGISAPAKRGALKSLTGQLKESVGYGAYQNFRALDYIMNSSSPEFKTEDGKNVLIDKSSKFYRITITLEHLADLIAYMYDLKEIGVIDKNIDFAWTCSIFDLMIFSEIIENEEDFMDYLDKRIPLYKRSELHFQDEIDLLGYFLEKNLEFDEKMIKGLTTFQLNKYSADIDKYFEKGGIKPKRKKKSGT